MSSIISTADLAAYMNKSLTAAVSKQVVDAVNAYIERATHRCWGDTLTVKEVHDWKPRIWLHHQDVRNISSIKFGYPTAARITIDSSSYYWNKLGRVSFTPRYGGWRYADLPEYVEVTYTYGVDEVPEDLKLAALGIAAGFYNWASDGHKTVSASQVGSYRVEYAGNKRAADSVDTTAEANFNVVASYATRRA